MAGLFDTFSIGKRGLSVAQSEINTTSHNIANANTTGYTRQRSVATTTTPYGGNSKFDSLTVGQVGTGAQISSIERIRDSFLDYQVRTQTTTNSSLDIQNTYLSQVEDVLDETSNNGVENSLSSFYKAFQTLSTSAEDSSNKTVAISAAATLASNLNDRYTQLENKQSSLQELMTTNVSDINSKLDQINDLNKQIEKVTSLGLTPNDLMDTRDNLLDDLSTQFGISIDSEKYNGTTVTSTQSNVGTLVDGTDSTASCTRFSSIASVDVSGSTVTVTYNKLGDSKNQGTLTVTATSDTEAATLKENLQKCGVLVADSSGNVVDSGGTTITSTDESTIEAKMFKPDGGEIGGNQAVQEEIQTCMDQLNNFAAALAYTANSIQTGSTTDNTNLLFVTDNDATSKSDSGITAKNIKVNSTLQNDPSLLNCAKTSTSGEKDGTRALAMADLSDLKIDFTSMSDVSSLTREEFLSKAGITFKDSANNDYNLVSSSSSGSTLNTYYSSMVSSLGTTASKASSDLTTSETQLTSIKNQRTSVSGVSLDEEMTSLIEYQHAYQANAKVISTIDSLLDVVINGLMS